MGKRIAASITLAIVVFASAYAQAGYQQDLRRVTEKGNLYHINNWDAELIWYATFFSDRFRKSFEKRHEKLRYLSRPEVDQYISEHEMRQAAGWEFFISIYTKKKYKNISNYSDSFWKIYLITDSGERISPTSVEPVPVTPYEKKMFPYIDRWSKTYLVVFPKVDIGDDFELQIDSVVGNSTLKFEND
jgi:hypothetical protein